MRISPIFYYAGYNKKFQNNNIKTAAANTFHTLPLSHANLRVNHLASFANINFEGGYSLDLAQTLNNFEKNNVAFPPDIHDAVERVVKQGNPEDKTLIDIHKEKYENLLAAYNLDEAKELYPEFNGVLSDSQVEYRNGSLLARVKNGECENFNKDEDMALQLLKLYWGQGFSLTDLKEYADNTSLYSTMLKLNIPMLDKTYGQILKFSDKEYNERLTSQMAQKRMESRDRMAQEKQGEPVYIPRGPLSDAHKKHISEGLVKYYAQNPNKLSEMSQRQREYFENNPAQKLRMQKAMLFAWNNTQEGKSLKKHLSKFFKKAGIDFSEIEKNNFEVTTPEQKKTLREFWQRNPWAATQFSYAVTKGWQKVKQDESDDTEVKSAVTEQAQKVEEKTRDDKNEFIYRMMPEELIQKTYEKAKETDAIYANLSEPYIDMTTYDPSKNNNEKVGFGDCCCMYFPNDYQQTLYISFLSLKRDIDRKKLPIRTLNDRKMYNEIKNIRASAKATMEGSDDFSSENVEFCFLQIAKKAYEMNHPEMLRYLENKLDSAYKLVNSKSSPTYKKDVRKFVGADDF